MRFFARLPHSAVLAVTVLLSSAATAQVLPDCPAGATVYVVGVGGNSNAVGYGDAAASAARYPGTERVAASYERGALTALRDPVGFARSDATGRESPSGGSPWPAFAHRFHALTGACLTLVPRGAPSTTTERWAPSSRRNDAFPRLVRDMQEAADALRARGYRPVSLGWLFNAFPRPDDYRPDAFGAAFTRFLGHYAAAYPDQPLVYWLPGGIVRQGRVTDEWRTHRAALRRACEASPHCLIGSTAHDEAPAAHYYDHIHITKPATWAVGEDLAEAVAAHYRLTTGTPRPPAAPRPPAPAPPAPRAAVTVPAPIAALLRGLVQENREYVAARARAAGLTLQDVLDALQE